jgi:hypothetical protein
VIMVGIDRSAQIIHVFVDTSRGSIDSYHAAPQSISQDEPSAVLLCLCYDCSVVSFWSSYMDC